MDYRKPFTYEAHVKLTIIPKPEEGRSTVKETNVHLDVPYSVGWKRPDGLPNKDGMKAQTQALIQGLIATIHFAHQKNMWDSADHMKYVIDNLQRGFIAQAEAYEADYDN